MMMIKLLRIVNFDLGTLPSILEAIVFYPNDDLYL